MIVFREAPEATRWRAVPSPALAAEVPAEALEPGAGGRVHWAGPAGATDPFLQGVEWGLSFSLTTVFGTILGGLLNEAALSNVERWTGSTWVPVA